MISFAWLAIHAFLAKGSEEREREREQEVGRFPCAIDSNNEAHARSVTLHHKKFPADGGSDGDGIVSYYYALVKVQPLLRTYINIMHEKII